MRVHRTRISPFPFNNLWYHLSTRSRIIKEMLCLPDADNLQISRWP